MTSRQADQAATFNYASQAHNNHFFFQSLVRAPDNISQSMERGI